MNSTIDLPAVSAQPKHPNLFPTNVGTCKQFLRVSKLEKIDTYLILDCKKYVLQNMRYALVYLNEMMFGLEKGTLWMVGIRIVIQTIFRVYLTKFERCSQRWVTWR